MTTTESLSHVKDRLSEFADRVEQTHERVYVTRNGRAAFVMVSVDDLEGLEMTLEIARDPAASADVLEALAAHRRGDVDPEDLVGVDAVTEWFANLKTEKSGA